MRTGDSTSSALPLITEAEVAAALDIGRLLDGIEAAHIAFSHGDVAQPVRTAVPLAETNGFMFTMPARWTAAGVKIVTLNPANARRGIPTHFATVIMLHPETGEPLALLEAGTITKLRTAAASGVATRHLVNGRPSKLALLGSGVQAEGHLAIMRHLYDLEEVAVWGPTEENVRRFADTHRCVVASSPRAAADEADIIVVATAATQPVLQGGWIKPGAHVNAVGAPRPDWRELDDDVMRNIVVVDSFASARSESGDIIGSGCEIFAELGQIAASAKVADRTRTTVFKSLGLAVQDVAAGAIVLEHLGIGAKSAAAAGI